MENKIHIALCFVLCTCALPRAALCAETEPDAVPTAQRLFAGMKKAAKVTVNRTHGLGEVAPRAPYRGAIAIDAATFHGRSLGIKAGEVITIENLLYALMIRSANDGAVVLAEHSGGHLEVATSATLPEMEVSKHRVQTFVDRMNRRTRETSTARILHDALAVVTGPAWAPL